MKQILNLRIRRTWHKVTLKKVTLRVTPNRALKVLALQVKLALAKAPPQRAQAR